MRVIKECVQCGCSYIRSENQEDSDMCFACNKEADEVIDLKKNFEEDPEVVAYIEKERKRKEDFMRLMLKKHLKWHHKPAFWLYEKLSDFFVPRVKVVVNEGYQDEFGIEIYGEKYLMPDKPVQNN